MSKRKTSTTTRTVAGLVLLAAAVSPFAGSFASYSASTTNPEAVEIGTASPPTNLVATVDGADVVLTWDPGSVGGEIPGYRLRKIVMVENDGLADGSSAPSGCTDTASFTTTGQVRLAAGATTRTDVNVGTTSTSGSYRCYRLESEYPATPATPRWWSLSSPTVLIQVGHAVKTMEVIDGGTPGELRAGDQFRFTFIQPVDTSTGPVDTSGGSPPTAGNDICAYSTQSVIVVARATSELNTTCASADPNLGGRFNSMTMSAAATRRNAYHATYEWSNCPVVGECLVLTATLGAVYLGVDDISVSTSSASHVQPTTLLLAAANGQALCNVSNSSARTCRPILTGSL